MAPSEWELGTGDVHVTLVWNGAEDLQLQVFDPAGHQINADSARSASDGSMDRADRPSNKTVDGIHATSVFRLVGTAPEGEYEALMTTDGRCDGTDGRADDTTVADSDAVDDIDRQTATHLVEMRTVERSGASSWSTESSRVETVDDPRSLMTYVMARITSNRWQELDRNRACDRFHVTVGLHDV